MEDPAKFMKLQKYPPSRKIDGPIEDLDPRVLCVCRTFVNQMQRCFDDASSATSEEKEQLHRLFPEILASFGMKYEGPRVETIKDPNGAPLLSIVS